MNKQPIRNSYLAIKTYRLLCSDPRIMPSRFISVFFFSFCLWTKFRRRLQCKFVVYAMRLCLKNIIYFELHFCLLLKACNVVNRAFIIGVWIYRSLCMSIESWFFTKIDSEKNRYFLFYYLEKVAKFITLSTLELLMTTPKMWWIHKTMKVSHNCFCLDNWFIDFHFVI